MANIVYNNLNDTYCEIGFQGESKDPVDVAAAVSPTITLAYIRSLTINADESVTREKIINSGNGRNITHNLKGMHSATATISFNVSQALDAAAMNDAFFLKMPIDGADTTSVATYTMPPTANEFGSDYLMTFTIEAGYSSGANVNRLKGCIVNSMTFKCGKSQFNALWTYNILGAMHEQLTAFTVGSLTEDTGKPLTWENVEVQYGAANALATFTDITDIEFTIDNGIEPGVYMNNATTNRVAANTWLLGTRKISGVLSLNLNTSTKNGHDLWEDLYGDSTGTASPTQAVTLNDLQITLYQATNLDLRYTLHDVILGRIPHDLAQEGVHKIAIPFTAQACIFRIRGTDSSSPTNWAGT